VIVDSVTSLTSLRTSQWFRLLRPLYKKTLIENLDWFTLCISLSLCLSVLVQCASQQDTSGQCRLLLHPSANCRHVDATRSHARLFTTQQNDVVSRDSPHPVPSNVAHLPPPGHLPLDTDIYPGPNHNRSLTLTSLRWPWFLGSLHDAAHSALGRRRQISIDSWRAPLLRVDRHQSVVVPLTAYWLSTGQTDRETDGHRTVT